MGIALLRRRYFRGRRELVGFFKMWNGDIRLFEPCRDLRQRLMSTKLGSGDGGNCREPGQTGRVWSAGWQVDVNHWGETVRPEAAGSAVCRNEPVSGEFFPFYRL